MAGLGVSPAAPSSPYTDNTSSTAAMRLGFVSALPEPAQVRVTRARAGRGMSQRHKAAQAVTKMSQADQQCLAEALYYEARGEGRRGQMAVAEVVVNRAHDARYPRSICGVVYQGNPGGTTNCQFSWACNGDMNRGREKGAWATARRLASSIATGKVPLEGITNRALFFHATSVAPNWRGLVRTTQIGNHVFYARNPGYRAPHITRSRRHDDGRIVRVRVPGVIHLERGSDTLDARAVEETAARAALSISIPLQMGDGA